ncbi:OLC1v1004669C1 [Oldenlandia corymbosa var. corymbosa]|uniref:OLC1v1004669C1 n=1 Tax=Oldenlandia corymbosa var. corymbosa TaxID=529605 RepID=A0AAV1DCX1_OLDCO|nr:OLC1v1004669C1 [Oldenlandia corymbosa var. corymbosa]
MTRILVQRGSTGSASSSSSNQTRPSAVSPAPSSSSSAPPTHLQATNNNTGSQNQAFSTPKDEELVEEDQEQVLLDNCSEQCSAPDSKGVRGDDISVESLNIGNNDDQEEVLGNELLSKHDFMGSGDLMKGGLSVVEEETEGPVVSSVQMVTGSTCPPPPPVPPPRPASFSSNLRRSPSGSSNALRSASSWRPAGRPTVSTRTSPTGSRPSSPRSHCESEGYNSADEQSSCFGSSYDDAERERQFELDLRRVKGLEVKKMLEDGNCLFRAVADQVYGDSEAYDLVRQMCIDYMERERDHFSQFITEGFTSYCKRKRRDKVYGNNVEIQALSEMYNRPIHIYSYSTDPINTFHGNYTTDTPPIRLSYHHGNHYNSLVDPRRLSVGAGLGFSSLRGANVDKDQVKAAIKAQQDQQIDNALLAEGRFYSDLELTEKEIEHMVMEASRADYLANDKFKQQIGYRESSTSGAEPSSSGASE